MGTKDQPRAKMRGRTCVWCDLVSRLCFSSSFATDSQVSEEVFFLSRAYFLQHDFLSDTWLSVAKLELEHVCPGHVNLQLFPGKESQASLIPEPSLIFQVVETESLLCSLCSERDSGSPNPLLLLYGEENVCHSRLTISWAFILEMVSLQGESVFS
jgi:hypothetical protein